MFLEERTMFDEDSSDQVFPPAVPMLTPYYAVAESYPNATSPLYNYRVEVDQFDSVSVFSEIRVFTVFSVSFVESL